jgi:hypothetical protein
LVDISEAVLEIIEIVDVFEELLSVRIAAEFDLLYDVDVPFFLV